MDIRVKTIKGIGWSGLSQTIRLLFQFIVTAILAHLLNPKDFGLLAMVFVFTNFVVIFKDLGLSAAIIQKEKITDEHLSSSFWLNVLMGFMITIILILLAHSISSFYNEKRLVPIIMIISSTFFISSLGITHYSILTKEMKFKKLSLIEVSTTLLSGLLAILLAFLRFGIWSLVLQQIFSSFIMTCLLWLLSDWNPKLYFYRAKVKELLNFGLNLTGFNFVNYFNRNIDNLLIGKFLGSFSLGLYDLAYRILLFPVSNISHIIGKVMFPAFSLIQKNKEKVKGIYLQTTKTIALITFPLMTGLIVLAPEFILFFFGNKWIKAVFIVRVLAIMGLGQSVGTTVGWIYQSQGRTDIMFKWGIFSSIVYTISFIIGVQWGVNGVAISYTVAGYLITYPAWQIPFKLIDLKIMDFIKQFKSILLSTLIMGFLVYIEKMILCYFDISILVILILCFITGVTTYFGFLFFYDKLLYKLIKDLVKQLMKKNDKK